MKGRANMLTPVDIENKEFTKAFRGYDIYEVEEFMKALVVDYEKLYRDNGDLKEKNALLNDAITNYKGMEETMQNAILVAQRTAEDIKQNAYERSETIVKDAERRAAEAIDNANRAISNLEKTYLSMQQEMNGFKAKMSALLSTYSQLLSELPEQTAASKPFKAELVAEPVPEKEEKPAEAPVQEKEVNCEDTNVFTLPLTTPKEEEPKPVQVIKSAPAGFQSERKLNPVVEELLRKKKEEQQKETMKEEVINEEPTKEEPAEEKSAEEEEKGFSVTKDIISKDAKSDISEIDLRNLQSFDVFTDDSI